MVLAALKRAGKTQRGNNLFITHTHVCDASSMSHTSYQVESSNCLRAEGAAAQLASVTEHQVSDKLHSAMPPPPTFANR